MKLNIRVASLLPLEIISGRIDLLSEPLIILDEYLRIIAKNRPAAKILSNLRHNRRINGFLQEGDVERISRMETGQMFHVSLFDKDKEYGASVICGNGYRIIALSPFFADVHHSIERIYDKTSGYDIELRMPPAFDNVKTENNAYHILSSVKTKEHIDKSAIFSSAKLVRQLALEANAFGRGINASVTTDVGGIYGSEYDFAMILAYLISFFDNTSYGEGAELSLTVSGQNAVVTVSGATYLAEQEISSLMNGTDGESSSAYWFRILALLAEGNLWRFSMDSSREGSISFRLEAPLAEMPDGCVLRDVDRGYIREILSFVFDEKTV